MENEEFYLLTFYFYLISYASLWLSVFVAHSQF